VSPTPCSLSSRSSLASFSAGCLDACGSSTSSETLRRSGRSESVCWTVADRLLHGRRFSGGGCGGDSLPTEGGRTPHSLAEADAPGGADTAEPCTRPSGSTNAARLPGLE
jgi:hypothetical protein